MNVGDICSHRPVSAPVSATLAEVAQLMRREGVGAVVITRSAGGRAIVAGMITDRDIVRAQLEHTADLARLAAGDTMTRDPLMFAESESIAGALANLRARGVRRAPVVDAKNALVGVISTDDLLAYLAQTLIGAAGIVAQQAQHE